jgi:hypothetical protein
MYKTHESYIQLKGFHILHISLENYLEVIVCKALRMSLKNFDV